MGRSGQRRSLALGCLVLSCVAATTACAGEQPASGALVPTKLPGAAPWEPELAARLAEALAARDPSEPPRTRHLLPDGSPRYTNRLILEASPYLQQHAHNPVNWFPWGDEAFAEAARLGRPVFLSIGYSTCHWCHVMEEESFEDEEIATLLNERYVAIKVDREERPDLDSIYMNAVAAFSGHGGWPATLWLTPEREPFHGGTYFPAREGDRPGQTGLLTLLRKIDALYRENPGRIAAAVEPVVRKLEEQAVLAPGAIPKATSVVDRAVSSWRGIFDSENGGLGGAPKFPTSLPLRLLLRVHARTGDRAVERMVRLTLEKMAAGGIHDQLGGGFHRYATDAAWSVPHFEKMLYDNAQLAMAYAEAGQAFGEPAFHDVARRTLEYVERELTSPEGAFYSATDADSANEQGRREEGRYFTWTADEIRAVVGPEEAPAVLRQFGVVTPGPFAGRNVLRWARPPKQVAREPALAPGEHASRIEAARKALLAARSSRPAPLRDEKVIASWNGLMISAMARAGFILDEPRFVERAERALELVLTRMQRDGRLVRIYKDGRAVGWAVLDDYAFVIAAALDVYEATGRARWLEAAVELQATQDAHFSDPEAGGYFMTADDHERLLVREKPAYDSSEPSGNSVALQNLLRLAELTGRAAYREQADRLLEAFSELLREQPTTVSEMLLALEFLTSAPREIAIVMPPGGEAGAMLNVLRETYSPGRVVALVKEDERGAHEALIPWIAGKVAREGNATAYVCQSGTCGLPATDAEELRRQLRGSRSGS